MPKKVYAVRKGYKTGIFYSWDECKSQINGFSGAEYKSFKTISEAEDFLNAGKNNSIDDSSSEKAIAYVDGSYLHSKREYSYGIVMFYNGKEEHFYEKFNDLELREMRNVAGEIKGAEMAMKYCIENNIEILDLYYDYEGIEKWCTGVWKANKTGTKNYKAYYDSIKNNLKVNFVKVTGHSGDKYNDMADELAKKALGL